MSTGNMATRLGPAQRVGYDKTCSVDGCDRPHRSRGYCHAHYRQVWRGQQTTALKPPNAPAGSGSINNNGYRMLKRNGTAVLEHRETMERMLGRKLLPFENVHHINGIRHDNRPENLELWVVKQPKGQRPADLVAWAKDILSIYEPGALRCPSEM